MAGSQAFDVHSLRLTWRCFCLCYCEVEIPYGSQGCSVSRPDVHCDQTLVYFLNVYFVLQYSDLLVFWCCFFSTGLSDWIGKVSVKWCILFQVRLETLTQSVWTCHCWMSNVCHCVLQNTLWQTSQLVSPLLKVRYRALTCSSSSQREKNLHKPLTLLMMMGNWLTSDSVCRMYLFTAICCWTKGLSVWVFVVSNWHGVSGWKCC